MPVHPSERPDGGADLGDAHPTAVTPEPATGHRGLFGFRPDDGVQGPPRDGGPYLDPAGGRPGLREVPAAGPGRAPVPAHTAQGQSVGKREALQELAKMWAMGAKLFSGGVGHSNVKPTEVRTRFY